mmetsp:Transcript_10642/g.24241  ORF Transcript_10642/g.24241 Transcript_10642/m.24241 type:complete len:223 (+) Transcript_10642:2000-2668(+)
MPNRLTASRTLPITPSAALPFSNAVKAVCSIFATISRSSCSFASLSEFWAAIAASMSETFCSIEASICCTSLIEAFLPSSSQRALNISAKYCGSFSSSGRSAVIAAAAFSAASTPSKCFDIGSRRRSGGGGGGNGVGTRDTWTPSSTGTGKVGCCGVMGGVKASSEASIGILLQKSSPRISSCAGVGTSSAFQGAVVMTSSTKESLSTRLSPAVWDCRAVSL